MQGWRAGVSLSGDCISGVCLLSGASSKHLSGSLYLGGGTVEMCGKRST